MFVPDAASLSWLHGQWQALAARLSASGAAAQDAWELLERRYSEPHRAYHNLSHIAAMLRRAQAERAHIKQPEVVEFSIWFHDLVYDTHADDNECRSAELACESMHSMGITRDVIVQVEQCIRATHKHETGTSLIADLPLFLDIDLAILGAPPQVYRAYSRAIRAEYGWVPEAAYRSGRANVLTRFLDRTRLFFTSTMAGRLETPARHNIESELRALTSS